MADIFNIGVSGLNVARKGLETSGHNVANANTDGYSRQRVGITTGIPVVKQGLTQGTGAQVSGVKRINDEFIEKKLNSVTSENHYNDFLAGKLGQVERIYGDVDGSGINKSLTRFFNSFSELAGNPEDEAIRSYVRENASLLSQDFIKMNKNLSEISQDIDLQISLHLEDINELTKQIANLNKKIQVMVATGGHANDLMDQREIAVRSLSKILKINTYEDNKNNFNVNIDGAGTLVSGGIYQKLVIGPYKTKTGETNPEIFFQSRPGAPITKKINSGSLGASIYTKNEILNGLKDKFDNVAYNLIKAVNNIHQRGFANRNVPLLAQEYSHLNDSMTPITGINFFKNISTPSNASSNVELSEEIKADLSNISTGLIPNMPGDNRVALAISKIPHQKILNNGKATIEEEYLKSMADLGLASGKAQLNHEQSQGILAQVNSLKERISGVSLDEEATNLIRFQNAYQASAKVIKESDDMLKAVLNLKQ